MTTDQMQSLAIILLGLGVLIQWAARQWRP